MKYFFLLLFFFSSIHSFSQKEPNRMVAGIPVNYSEDSVGTYTLPDPLLMQNGKLVKDAATWTKKRRPEIMQLYEENQFGKMPGKPSNLRFEVQEKGTLALNGKAMRKQVTIYFASDTVHKMDILIYLPVNTTKPTPLLLHIAFSANSNVIADSAIKESMMWSREGKRIKATEAVYPNKLNILPFIENGFGVATVYYGDIEPDF